MKLKIRSILVAFSALIGIFTAGGLILAVPSALWAAEEDFENFEDSEDSDDSEDSEGEGFEDDGEEAFDEEEEAATDVATEEESKDNELEDDAFEDEADFDGEELKEEKTVDTEVLPEPEKEEGGLVLDESDGDEEQFSAVTISDSGPDLDYESRLYQINSQFHSKKMSDQTWTGLLGKKAIESYNIQSGDNLWDISKTFFGDGNFWPKVWATNRRITNPHLIAPSNKIQFILGTESDLPSFAITDSSDIDVNEEGASQAESPEAGEESVEENAEESAEESAEEAGLKVDIPPGPKFIPVAVVPPSFPDWRVGYNADEYDEVGISYIKRPILQLKDTIPFVSYISETAPSSLGTIMEIEVGYKMASINQYIYVSMNEGEVEVGDSFLVVRDRGEVKNHVIAVKGEFGHNIQVQGIIEITDRIGREEKVEGQAFFRAVVKKIINPIQLGAVLVRGKLEQISLSHEGTRSRVVAQIIGGGLLDKRDLFGAQSIVYLNRGKNDGLMPGQILPIRSNRLLRVDETESRTHLRRLGWLKVVRTTPRFATAVITKSWAEIYVGDYIGDGDLVKRVSSLSEMDEDEELLESATEEDDELDEEGFGEEENAEGDDEEFGDEEEDVGLDEENEEEGLDDEDEEGASDDESFEFE